MATLPFSPVTSAALTAIDVLVLSAQSILEELVSPGGAARVRETLLRAEQLERDITAKLAEVKALQDRVEATKKRIEAEQAEPAAACLVDIVETARRGLRATKLCLPFPGSAVTFRKGSLKIVLECVRKLAETVGEPDLIDGKVVALDDQQLFKLEEKLWDLFDSGLNPPAID